MKIAVLTSSRADFGIYLPLLNKLKTDPFFNLEIIAFGTHLSADHGYTLNEIKSYEFLNIHQINTSPNGDSPKDISNSMAKTIGTFSNFWSQHQFDLVFALGDRYEMFSAVVSSSPFNVDIAHIHAGETTLGAIDNAFRHGISHLSKILLTSSEVYKSRAEQIVDKDKLVFNVGALSIDNLKHQNLLSIDAFKSKFNIDLSIPTILSTFHPETVSLNKNETYIHELMDTFVILSKKYQVVITMPNADTMGNVIREVIISRSKKISNIKLIESFGMEGYLSCMKHCSFMLGNTSSGFIEASYFPKYVINIGDRQKGRIITENIFSIPVSKHKIIECINKIEKSKTLSYSGIYGMGNTANEIVKVIKKIYA